MFGSEYYSYCILNNKSEKRDLRCIDDMLKKASIENPNEEERIRVRAELEEFRAGMHRRKVRDARREEKRLVRKSKVVRGGRP